MSLPKKEIRYRLVHTIPEAMILMHESNRSDFIRKFIDTGLLGVYEGNKVLRKDIERVLLEGTIYKLPHGITL